MSSILKTATLTVTENLCPYCNKVLNSESCMLCDVCNKWLHKRCTKLTSEQYDNLANSDRPFYCLNCLCNTLPFVTTSKRDFSSLFSFGSSRLRLKKIKYPCKICSKPCKSNQNSIECSICNYWAHLTCSQLTNIQYLNFVNDKSLVFYCQKCCLDVFPFTSINNDQLISLNNKHSFTDYNSFNSSQDEIVNNNLNNNQYIEIDDIKGIYKELLTIIFINIRSLNANFDKLYNFINSAKIRPDIIGVSETWINGNRPFIKNLPGYDFISKNSSSNSGGVAFFIAKKISFMLKTYCLNVDNCEDIWIEIKLPSKKRMTIGTIYRHPGHNFYEYQNSIVNLINSLNNNNKIYVFGGDLNINLLKDNSLILDYSNTLLSLGCDQTVTAPTRYSNNFLNSSLLDHIYTNITTQETITNVIMHDISDHLPIILGIKEKKLINQ